MREPDPVGEERYEMSDKLGPFDAYQESMEKLRSGGLLLVSGDKGNPMTIGWATVGVIWGIPIFTVLVRPSRFSFGLVETHGEFTICVPSDDMAKEVALCGSRSGRDMDKVKECGFSLEPGNLISIPHIKACPIHYECRVLHKTSVINADLDREIARNSYAGGDLHRIYHGEILGVYR